MDYLEFFKNNLAKFLLSKKIFIYDIQKHLQQNFIYLTISLFKKDSYLNVDDCQLFHKEANKLILNNNMKNILVSEVKSVGINTVVKNDYQLSLLKDLIISCKTIAAINNFYVIDAKLINFDDQFLYLKNKIVTKFQ